MKKKKYIKSKLKNRIPVIGNVSDADIKNIATGIDMTIKEFLKAFEKHGLTRISPLGQKYDYNFHEAAAKVPDADKEEGTVLQVIRAGYLLNGRLIQSAMVTVSTKPTNEGE